MAQQEQVLSSLLWAAGRDAAEVGNIFLIHLGRVYVFRPLVFKFGIEFRRGNASL